MATATTIKTTDPMMRCVGGPFDGLIEPMVGMYREFTQRVDDRPKATHRYLISVYEWDIIGTEKTFFECIWRFKKYRRSVRIR